MKLLNLFFFTSLLGLSVACNKYEEDFCLDDTLEETIVGKWNTWHAFFLKEVEFKSDGTLIDPGGALISVFYFQDEKSYVVDSNSGFTLTVIHDGKSERVSYDVSSFTCDEIILDVDGSKVKMFRDY